MPPTTKRKAEALCVHGGPSGPSPKQRSHCTESISDRLVEAIVTQNLQGLSGRRDVTVPVTGAGKTTVQALLAKSSKGFLDAWLEWFKPVEACLTHNECTWLANLLAAAMRGRNLAVVELLLQRYGSSIVRGTLGLARELQDADMIRLLEHASAPCRPRVDTNASFTGPTVQAKASCFTHLQDLPRQLLDYLCTFLSVGSSHQLRQVSKTCSFLQITRQLESTLRQSFLTLAVRSRDPRMDLIAGFFHVGYVHGIVLDGETKAQPDMWMIVSKKVAPDDVAGDCYGDLFARVEEHMQLVIDEDVIFSWNMYGGSQQYQFDQATTLHKALELVQEEYKEAAQKYLSQSAVPFKEGILFNAIKRQDKNAYRELATVDRWW